MGRADLLCKLSKTVSGKSGNRSGEIMQTDSFGALFYQFCVGEEGEGRTLGAGHSDDREIGYDKRQRFSCC